MELVLFRPSRHSNIYLVDAFTGIVYGKTRTAKSRWILLSLGEQMAEDGDLEPMPQTKKLREVRDHYNHVFGVVQ